MKLLPLLALVLLCACSHNDKRAADAEISAQENPDVEVRHLRFYGVRATGGVRNGSAAAYATIENTESIADTLISVSSPLCGAAELHEMVERNGVMTMRAANRMIIPPSGRLALQPGGTHIMLMQLAQSVRKNDSIDIVLYFARAGTVSLRAGVR